jgi:hypothetical protein
VDGLLGSATALWDGGSFTRFFGSQKSGTTLNSANSLGHF